MPETKRRRSSGEPSVVVIGVPTSQMPEIRTLLKVYGVTNVQVTKHTPRFSRRLTEAFNLGKQKALSGGIALPATGHRPEVVKHAPRSAHEFIGMFEYGKQKALGHAKRRPAPAKHRR